jgi:hypothetical protein
MHTNGLDSGLPYSLMEVFAVKVNMQIDHYEIYNMHEKNTLRQVALLLNFQYIEAIFYTTVPA